MTTRMIDFATLKRACKYRQLSRDVYGGEPELHYTCHHYVHEPSWGDCDESSCPMLRTTQEDD